MSKVYDLPETPVLPVKERVKHRKRLLLGLAFGFTVLGSLMTIIAFLAWFLLFAGTPDLTEPPAPTPLTTRPDLTVQVSQDYVNREIAANLAQHPLSAFNLVEVRAVTTQFQSGSEVDINVGIVALTRRFDFKIKDRLYAQNSKAVLKLIEDVRLQGLPIPLGILNGVVEQVNQSVTEQLNQQLVKAGVTTECPVGQSTCRPVRILNLSTQSGRLNAELEIQVK